MRRPSTAPTHRPFAFLVGLLLTAGLWIAVAPAHLGGQLSFVMVAGTSMEPALQDGDLVVVRRGTYNIGDVVAFRADGGHVIHRLVDGSPTTGWRAKGDNRRDIDSWHIEPHDVLGRQWIVLRGAAPSAAALRSPTGLGVLAAIAVLVLGLPSRNKRLSDRSRRPGRHLVERDDRVADITTATHRWKPRVPRPIELPLLVTALMTLFAAAAAVLAALPMNALLPISSIRISLVAVAVLGMLSTLLGLRRSLAVGGSALDKAHALLRDRCIQVQELPWAAMHVTIDTAKDLERIAVTEGTTILHLVDGTVHRYQVLGIGAVYEFVVHQHDLPRESVDEARTPAADEPSMTASR